MATKYTNRSTRCNTCQFDGIQIAVFLLNLPFKMNVHPRSDSQPICDKKKLQCDFEYNSKSRKATTGLKYNEMFFQMIDYYCLFPRGFVVRYFILWNCTRRKVAIAMCFATPRRSSCRVMSSSEGFDSSYPRIV